MAFAILVFGVLFWLGLYLMSRDLNSPRLRFAGLGLVSYALGWGCTILEPSASPSVLGLTLIRVNWSCFTFAVFFLTGAIIALLPEEIPFHGQLRRIWHYGFLPIVMLCSFLGVSTPLLFDGTPLLPRPHIAQYILSTVVLLPSLGVLCLVWQAVRSCQPKLACGVLLASLLFFDLGIGLLLFPQVWLPHTWVMLLLGVTLLVLGGAVAVLDAFDQGESLLPDVLRSFDFSFGTAFLFAGQVVLVILLGTGLTFALLALLLTTIATSIALQIFSNQVGTLLDTLAFATFPHIRKARAELRLEASTLPRVNRDLDLGTLDEVEFVRLTRRALSHFGDLARLAASPLTSLPLVEMRLAKRRAKGDALERAIELKALLTESILRLKPQNRGDFGTSDEWRYYNALYFPYIVGLKPYSRRAQHKQSDPLAQKALEWFRTSVPERTLHNWQTTATKLVAQDVREEKNN